MAGTSSLPSDAIQRILFISPRVHVYSIPPLSSTRGYQAVSWTTPNGPAKQIFTARLRVLETAIPLSIPDDSSGDEKISTEILLEDPATGQLFAGAPYTDARVVEPAVDSSRFFAVRVVGDGGRKAVLGIGFEERGEAIDFGITLQEVRKVQSKDGEKGLGNGKGGKAGQAQEEVKKDFSLKEGEMIHVDMGRKGRRWGGNPAKEEGGKGMFAIAPSSANGKPAEGSMPVLPPPPSAASVKERRRSQEIMPANSTAAELGFDDGEFGEFQ